LLDKVVKIKWNQKNIKHFESKGYTFTKFGDKFIVYVDELMRNSKIRVNVKCDYCGKIFEKTYLKYMNGKNNSVVNTDCCIDCVSLKRKDVFLLLYGEDNPQKIKHIRDKTKQTIINKYGVDNLMYNKDIANKVTIKCRKTLYENGNAPKSKQQEYLCNLLNGELNYPVDRCSLDIAFIKDKIYIEYDGSGHNLSVKYKNITLEEFNISQLKRYKFLKSNGWRLIRIKTIKDYLPLDSKIIEMIDYANCVLNNNYSWIEFNIDNNNVNYKNYSNYYNYDILRKI